MTREELFENIKKKQSFLCVGLDTDVNKIPEFMFDKYEGDYIFEFNKQIIDATAKYCVAYKPNLAFYESLGLQGWDVLERTVDYIRSNYPDMFLIADAKRGDIGNTSAMYARTFFGAMDFDSVTVAPYMGEDSVSPFLTYEGKWVTLLALTSNKGAFDFQFMKDAETGDTLYQKVLKTSKNWGNADNMMYVVGATKADMLSDIREIIPDNFLLVPGIGAQGGSLEEVVKHGMNSQCGLLVNSSRAIIYAANDETFAEAAAREAKKVQEQMAGFLKAAGMI
ncbi:MAG: orotidine-5'-phosphate decarboxylase [Paludibacteraceae bacterium]|jgi:orotidine-5'-phosphate decarboxylase|nr:orotidine-5'-phosphate decarboxylase [Paludibacteraceae bacterium]MDD5997878.1 orotidine-5'-phosphate decarboxylase [Bacteroidales bacterium]MDO4526217.1 orotidine-5'-phosphate decarboxylase [Bacteroidales bacterium]MEE1177546.1 orotidine-5'-phosphate decarboxylase [Paludibacteraceae bacterium]